MTHTESHWFKFTRLELCPSYFLWGCLMSFCKFFINQEGGGQSTLHCPLRSAIVINHKLVQSLKKTLILLKATLTNRIYLFLTTITGPSYSALWHLKQSPSGTDISLLIFYPHMSKYFSFRSKIDKRMLQMSRRKGAILEPLAVSNTWSHTAHNDMSPPIYPQTISSKTIVQE